MRRDLTYFCIAVAIQAVSGLVAMILVLILDDADVGTVVGGITFGLIGAALLVFFALRSHRWPKWVLLILLIGGIVGSVSRLDARSALALADALALVVLLKGWPRAEGTEETAEESTAAATTSTRL